MKVVLIAVAAVAIATSSAVGARSTASSFELVVFGSHELVPPGPAFPFGYRHRGTFVANPPFCSSGVFWDLTNDLLQSMEDTRLYTCSDGSGTLTTAQEDWFEHKPTYTSTWRIISGTGRYADLRGKGSYVGGPPLTGSNDDPDPLGVTYRCTYTGIVALDVVAPRIAVSSTAMTRLRSPAGTYAVRLVASVRDNVALTVSFLAAVEPGQGGLYLVQKKGSTATGAVAMTLRFRPDARTRTVQLHLRAEDEVGNWRWVTRRLKLPR